MRKIALLFCCSLAFGLIGCESDPEPVGTPCTSDNDCLRSEVCTAGTCTATDSDAGSDTNPTLDVDTSFDTGADTGADTGGTCENTCVRTADCSGLGLTSPQCIAGCCTEGSVGTACQAHLDPCTSDGDSTADFVCDTDAGVCLQRCNSETADDTESSDCPLNSYCFGDLGTGDDLMGACVPGDCDSNIFDAEACDGTGTCFPVGNGASYCLEAGTADVDDACNQEIAEDDSQPARDICAPGLLCFQGTCIEPCNLREADTCEGDTTCVRAFDITQRNQPGACGVECDSFSAGQCGEGEFCSFVGGRFGINAWMCVPQGDANIIEDAGADCNGTDDLCAEGLICVGEEGEATCLSICDPTGDTSAEHSDCGTEGEVCTPSSLSGFGFCQEECTPYPRSPGDYDCDTAGDMCIPFTSTDEEPVEPDGFCTADDGDVAAWDDCDNDGFLGAPCEDFAVCLALEDGDTPQCLPLCEPLGDTGCPDEATCSGVPPLLGTLSFSFCTPDAQAGDIGDRCTEAGFPCAADHSLCVDTGDGNTCVKVCREGFDDCADLDGMSCATDLFDPAFVPTYMGICLDS